MHWPELYVVHSDFSVSHQAFSEFPRVSSTNWKHVTDVLANRKARSQEGNTQHSFTWKLVNRKKLQRRNFATMAEINVMSINDATQPA